MKVLQTRWFARFARKESIPASTLLHAVERAEKGLIDAEAEQFKKMAKHVLALTDTQLDGLIANGQFEEVTQHDQKIPK